MNLDTLMVEGKTLPFPALLPGDTVKATYRVVEGEKERSQHFQGVVIRVKQGGVRSCFTVRRVSYGVGVERTFFFYSPGLENVEVLRRGKVRRARLYYLRGLTGKAARVKERKVAQALGIAAEVPPAGPVPAEAATETAEKPESASA